MRVASQEVVVWNATCIECAGGELRSEIAIGGVRAGKSEPAGLLFYGDGGADVPFMAMTSQRSAVIPTSIGTRLNSPSTLS